MNLDYVVSFLVLILALAAVVIKAPAAIAGLVDSPRDEATKDHRQCA